MSTPVPNGMSSDQYSPSDEADSPAPYASAIWKLVPVPPGGGSATWFKKKTFPIEKHVGQGFLTLTLDVYAYICDARPDEKFEDNGGELYVIIVQKAGSMYSPPSDTMTYVTLQLNVSGQTSSGQGYGMEPVLGSPAEQPDTTDDSHTYTLELDETKQMFKDNGNSTFEAHLQAGDKRTRVNYRQYFDTAPYQKWDMEVDNTVIFNKKPIPGTIPFFGISAFRSTHNLTKLSISVSPGVGYVNMPSPSIYIPDPELELNFTYPPARD